MSIVKAEVEFFPIDEMRELHEVHIPTTSMSHNIKVFLLAFLVSFTSHAEAVGTRVIIHVGLSVILNLNWNFCLSHT